jgi:LysM repeat protein
MCLPFLGQALPRAVLRSALSVHHVQAAFLASATFSGRSLLGFPAQPARIRNLRWLGVAVPAVAGVAAVIAMANAPAPAHSATPAAAHHLPATAAAATRPGASAALLTSGARAAARHAAARPARYTVKSGETLSVIAGHLYGNADYWPVLYSANQGQIRYANVIQAGQVLAVPAKPATIPSPPSAAGPAASPAPASAARAQRTYTPATTTHSASTQTAKAYSGTAGSFQACVIARESGGNSQVMNSSGHYGLYQFSASTWAAYGGNPADFGHASVAEQNQVFNNAMAAGGRNNWAPYDGC